VIEGFSFLEITALVRRSLGEGGCQAFILKPAIEQSIAGFFSLQGSFTHAFTGAFAGAAQGIVVVYLG
jgi:hypothetical protein